MLFYTHFTPDFVNKNTVNQLVMSTIKSLSLLDGMQFNPLHNEH
jgi:hypothetical protein